VVSGGFPCQDISAAGKGAGIDGERSGLWAAMARIIGEVRPKYVFVENSPLLVRRGLARVLADLAGMGFDAQWGVVGAVDAGAPHRRKRCWIVANANGLREQQPQWCEQKQRSRACNGGEELAHTNSQPWHEGRESYAEEIQGGRNTDRSGERTADVAYANGSDGKGVVRSDLDEKNREIEGERQSGPRRDGGEWWETEPDVGRVVNGVAARMDRLTAIGNGQVPQCAAMAWRILTGTRGST
jgi:DNA (cytosine-5)-methyltransferase 1